jgi:structure-specific endonuclease subunit SLX1
MSFFVYLLLTTATSGQQTYVGATVDLDHRLRQHNKEIKGGAHATSIQVERGASWERVCHVAGFPTWPAALQFEWRWKQISRKLPGKMDPLERRIVALKQLLSLDRATSKAVPYAEWPSPPRVVVESEKYARISQSAYSERLSELGIQKSEKLKNFGLEESVV